jgi:hypothetical protein
MGGKMRGDGLFAVGADEDKFLDPGGAGFLDGLLHDRLIDDREHLLGDDFGGGEKPSAEAGDRQDCLAHTHCHGIP